MPDYTITVSDNDVKIITRIANQTGRTQRQVVEYLVTTWCHGQIEGYYIAQIRDLTTAELIALMGDIDPADPGD